MPQAGDYDTASVIHRPSRRSCPTKTANLRIVRDGRAGPKSARRTIEGGWKDTWFSLVTGESASRRVQRPSAQEGGKGVAGRNGRMVAAPVMLFLLPSMILLLLLPTTLAAWPPTVAPRRPQVRKAAKTVQATLLQQILLQEYFLEKV